MVEVRQGVHVGVAFLHRVIQSGPLAVTDTAWDHVRDICILWGHGGEVGDVLAGDQSSARGHVGQLTNILFSFFHVIFGNTAVHPIRVIMAVILGFPRNWTDKGILLEKEQEDSNEEDDDSWDTKDETIVQGVVAREDLIDDSVVGLNNISTIFLSALHDRILIQRL